MLLTGCICFNFYLANFKPILLPGTDSITDKSFHSLPKNFQLISPATVFCVRSLGSKESCLIFTMRFPGFWASWEQFPFWIVPCRGPLLLDHLKAQSWNFHPQEPKGVASSQRFFPPQLLHFKSKAKSTNPDYTASIFLLLSFCVSCPWGGGVEHQLFRAFFDKSK